MRCQLICTDEPSQPLDNRQVEDLLEAGSRPNGGLDVTGMPVDDTRAFLQAMARGTLHAT